MKTMKGAVITGPGKIEISDRCPLPDKIISTGALIKPLIWSPCTSDAHLCATGCASLPYLIGKAVGHEMCGVITETGEDVHDFKVGDKVIVCSVMPVWRSLEAQDGHANNRQDNMYAGIDYPDRGGSFVESYYIRDADMNLTKIPEGVTLEQAVMVPDMMCTAFEGMRQLGTGFGETIAVIGIGPVGLMVIRAAVLSGAGRIFGIGSRKICFDVATKYGATDLIDYHDDYGKKILALNGGPVDGVIIAGGGDDSFEVALSIVKRGGTVVNLSAHFSSVPFQFSPAVFGFGYGGKTIKGIGCGGGRLWMARMASLIENRRVDPSLLITHRFHGMESIPKAMELFLNHDRTLIKPVIYND